MLTNSNGKLKNKLEFESRLIDEIKKRPCLYRTIDKKAETNYLRKIAWNEIKESISEPVDICKRKWNSLKSNFRKYHNKALENLEDITWIHYETIKSILEVESFSINDSNMDDNLKEVKSNENKKINQKTEISEIYRKCGEIMISTTKEFKFICWICQDELKDIEPFLSHIVKIHFESNNSSSTILENQLSIQNAAKEIELDHDFPFESTEIEINYKNESNEMPVNEEPISEKNGQIISLENKFLKQETNYKKKRGRKKLQELSANCFDTKSEKIKDSKRGIFSCEQCDRIFEYQSQLYRHKRLHTTDRPYKCEVCEQTFRHHRNLKDHFSVCHTEERPFPCRHEGCNKNFKTVRIRKLHEILHTNDLPFQCQDCGKCFPQSSYLITHRNTWHVDKKNRRHKCEHCEKTFYSKQNLKFHTYTHTGERPYGCPVCPTRFTKPWSVKEHMKIHSGERNYVCQVCGAAFNQIAGLIKHKKRHEEILE